MAQRREVRIAAHVDRMLRTGLHARVALPAEIGFDVVRPPVDRVDVHDVGRTDVHALAAAIALRHVGVGGHADQLLMWEWSAGRGRSDAPIGLLQPFLECRRGLVEHVRELGPGHRHEQQRREEDVEAEQHHRGRAVAERLREMPQQAECRACQQAADEQVGAHQMEGRVAFIGDVDLEEKEEPAAADENHQPADVPQRGNGTGVCSAVGYANTITMVVTR